jgi:hypothetical protein
MSGAAADSAGGACARGAWFAGPAGGRAAIDTQSRRRLAGYADSVGPAGAADTTGGAGTPGATGTDSFKPVVAAAAGAYVGLGDVIVAD